MEKQKPLVDKVRDYLLGRLSSKEQELFQQNMLEDIKIQLEVNQQEEIIKALRQKKLVEFESQTGAWEKQIQLKENRLVPMFKKIGVAASVALGLIFCYWFFQLNYNKTSLEQIADSFFEVPEVSGVIKKSAATSSFTEAFGLFTKGEFEESIAILGEIQSHEEQFANATFLLGLSHFKTGQYEKAIKSFVVLNDKPILNKLIARISISDVDKYVADDNIVDWYLALSYLAVEDQQECLDLLEPFLQEQNHPFHHKAKRLKAEIE